jgi:hypothetical protein
MRLQYTTPQFGYLHEFVDYWADTYEYKLEHLYESNMPPIRSSLTDSGILQLYEWKNGGALSQSKYKGILENYIKPNRSEDPFDATTYLSGERETGGPIWNIFYCHINDPETYPLFDQHVYRAAYFMQHGYITNDLKTDKAKYDWYNNWYMPQFIQKAKTKLDEHNPLITRRLPKDPFPCHTLRQLDKALFQFGRFLKAADKLTHNFKWYS